MISLIISKFLCDSIKELVVNHQDWAKDYEYDFKTNEFMHKTFSKKTKEERVSN